MSRVPTGLVPYPFLLRPDRWITLMLPADLTRADLDRLIAVLQGVVLPRLHPGGNGHRGATE